MQSPLFSVTLLSLGQHAPGEMAVSAPILTTSTIQTMQRTMKKTLSLAIIALLCILHAHAQRPVYAKMSGELRQLYIENQAERQAATRSNQSDSRTVCAFVRISSNAEAVFKAHGCKSLAQFGNIHIVNIPLNQLAKLSQSKWVSRIETGQSNSILMDTTAKVLNAWPAYQSQSLPQAYTGKGVVVGIQDIGFDLTHPNFCDSTGRTLRIKALWDQLSTDTLGTTLPVGRDYTTPNALIGLRHTRDGKQETHGTHTLGIAAGSGFKSPYRGMAWESDICLVANLTSENKNLVDKKDLYKYTTATDALGFKYIFDYAKRHNQPCVASFSEGSGFRFDSDTQLYHAVLDRLQGPGRIIVASAGNEGGRASYLKKPLGTDSAGTFIKNSNGKIRVSAKSKEHFLLRLRFHRVGTLTTYDIDTRALVAAKDSQQIDTLTFGKLQYEIQTVAYQPDDEGALAYEMLLRTLGTSTYVPPTALVLIGATADVELFRGAGTWETNKREPALLGGDDTHTILSPASAPAVIAVGATSYRTHITNYKGEKKYSLKGTGGVRAPYSSKGPTTDGRTKPDVMAPGSNIISSYNSFYIANHPNNSDVQWDVEHFQHNGRTYPWNCNTGTSMSAPAVAGAIALWLQANPTLTANDIRNIVAQTGIRHATTLPHPNNLYGYGQIDVYRGLLHILGITKVQDINQHQPQGVHIAPGNNNELHITFADGQPHACSLRLYSLSGSLVLSRPRALLASQSTIQLGALAAGVYVVQIHADSPKHSGSTLVRLVAK